MKALKVTINKSELQKFSQEELLFFLSSGHVINELMSLQKLLTWCSRFSSEELERKGRNMNSLLVCRTLIGKLNEANVLIGAQFYAAKLNSSYMDLLNDRAKDALKRISRYFNSKPNLIRDLRNTHSFHYYGILFPDLHNAITNIKAEEEWCIYLGENDGNTLFYLSDMLVGYTMLSAVDTDPQVAMTKLFEECLAVSKSFLIFFNGYMAAAIQKNCGGYEHLPSVQMELNNLRQLDDISIDYFFDVSQHGNPEVW
jgi:hypothetical protein